MTNANFSLSRMVTARLFNSDAFIKQRKLIVDLLYYIATIKGVSRIVYNYDAFLCRSIIPMKKKDNKIPAMYCLRFVQTFLVVSSIQLLAHGAVTPHMILITNN